MDNPLNVYDLCRHFVSDHAELIPSAEKNLLDGLIRSQSFKVLASISSDSRVHIENAATQRFYLQVEAFFKKNSAFRDEQVCRQAAIDSFERGERICRITNKRLDYYYCHEDRMSLRLDVLIARSVDFIEKSLGDFDSFMQALPSLVKVTSGATATLPRKSAIPPLKFKRRMDVTPGSGPYLEAIYRYFGYHKPSMRVQSWNRVEFVPKSWKTDRTIACEPSGTLPFQLAFDAWTKDRLKRYGNDLSTQKVNQRHAYEGSVNGSYATIDLSMASDTVAYNTVAWLLPEPWFQYLCDHRSSWYRLDDDVNKYAKFSSMGNGATFALETLIFLSFVHATGCTRGVVYGDDITISPQCVPDLMLLLKFFGFVPNEEKSFISGPFRESCGEHYYSGESVTPFYIREMEEWDYPTLSHIVNGVSRTVGAGDTWRYLRRLVKANRLLMTPWTLDTMAGVHLHPYFAYDKNLIRTRHGLQKAKTYTRKSKKTRFSDSRALACSYLSSRRGSTSLLCSKSPMDTRVLALAIRKEELRKDEPSWYSTATLKYKRKWESWQMPGQEAPESLFDFSEYLTAE